MRTIWMDPEWRMECWNAERETRTCSMMKMIKGGVVFFTLSYNTFHATCIAGEMEWLILFLGLAVSNAAQSLSLQHPLPNSGPGSQSTARYLELTVFTQLAGRCFQYCCFNRHIAILLRASKTPETQGSLLHFAGERSLSTACRPPSSRMIIPTGRRADPPV